MTTIPYVLLAAGLAVLFTALLVKRPHAGSGDGAAAAAIDRAELERTLERFVQQVKQEHRQALAEGRSREAVLQRSLTALEERVHRLEQELAKAAEERLQRPAASAGEDNQAAEDAFALKERYRRVFEWHREGLGVEEIARRLGAGKGEIQLILSLASSGDRRAAHE